MSRKTVTLFKWNPETGKFDVPFEISFTRPDFSGQHSIPASAPGDDSHQEALERKAWRGMCRVCQ